MDEAYKEVCSLFGEDPKVKEPSDFFRVFIDFSNQFQVSCAHLFLHNFTSHLSFFHLSKKVFLDFCIFGNISVGNSDAKIIGNKERYAEKNRFRCVYRNIRRIRTKFAKHLMTPIVYLLTWK